MHKLVILIEQPENWSDFDSTWPQFLHQAEQMPGLRREATSRVDKMVYGPTSYALMHELFFDAPEAAHQAMASLPGREAGRLLQAMTQGRMALFLADHKEDDLENIRKHTHPAE